MDTEELAMLAAIERVCRQCEHDPCECPDLDTCSCGRTKDAADVCCHICENVDERLDW